MSADLERRLEALEQGRSGDDMPRPLSWFYGEDEPVQSISKAKPTTLAEFYRQANSDEVID